MVGGEIPPFFLGGVDFLDPKIETSHEPSLSMDFHGVVSFCLCKVIFLKDSTKEFIRIHHHVSPPFGE